MTMSVYAELPRAGSPRHRGDSAARRASSDPRHALAFPAGDDPEAIILISAATTARKPITKGYSRVSQSF
jgi:hypothetical protein